MARQSGPSISDDLLFEALLKQGCSAEKAARIAHIRDPLESWEDEDPQPSFIGRANTSKEDLVETLRKG